MNAIVLPRYAFVKAWESGGYGKPHPVIGTDDLWLDGSARKLLQREVGGLLEKAGAAVDGVPTPEFRRKLAVLARPERECYAWISHHGEPGAALVAAIGGEAVRLVRDEKSVILDAARADDLPGTVVDALPDARAADIGEIVIPVSQYSARGPATSEDYELTMETRQQRPDPAARVRALMNAPRSGMHQLAAAARDRSGQRRRGRTVTVIDLVEAGRILSYVGQPPNGEPMLHCVSGTRRALLSTLAAG
ncbi:ESX secretion-associated protein EspG [Amycolatopsis rhizosphaerae]|uniref:ESX secretion-associated protein EspG n=1 Tax=Amycolatopsis rhizosphaerae TaxID=2053003 RepID=UPI001643E051|nr:ESX secretion-associated protein EspG [Amycolatopsis rhizosphaerae]